MRILMLNYEYPPLGGGAGFQTSLLARAFVKRGHEVVILTSARGMLSSHEMDAGIEIHRLPVARFRPDRCSLFSMAAYVALAVPVGLALIRDRRPDAILAFFLQPVGPVALALRACTGIPYVVSLRGGDVPSFVPAETGRMHRWLRPVTEAVVRGATQLVAVSDDLAGMAIHDFPNAIDKISTIRNAIELPNESNSRPQIPTFLFAGRLTPQKNLGVVLRALRSVEGEYRLHILGDGPQRADLEALAVPLRNKVVFHGWTDTVFQHLNHTHFLLLPSLAEGISNSGLQALARGVPIIGADSPGIRSFIEPNRTGFLFPAQDVAALTAILNELTAHPEKSCEMAPACREAITRGYSLNASADAYIDLLRSVAKGRP